MKNETKKSLQKNAKAIYKEACYISEELKSKEIWTKENRVNAYFALDVLKLINQLWDMHIISSEITSENGDHYYQDLEDDIKELNEKIKSKKE